ncbi:hypothetical protein ABZ820_40265 [Streptomyces diacarni]|uniref:Hydantoin racemase n=1 Tax=Streptomyces diacarni TaxID=2800381 RepID=A0A367F459_9ACTN|nr:hypothetical protein [Streptomyces diacarni]RCG24709.1 hypothetical protein DTL70_10195 [Streptomyces diacarni]
MKILSVTPVRVGESELARRRERYRRLSPPGVEVHLEPAGTGAPTELATHDDIAASTASVTGTLAAAGTDAHTLRMPDCVLDPGVPLTPDPSPTTTSRDACAPVVGMLRLTASHLVATGRPFGAVTRNPAIGQALAALLDAYGHGPWFAGVTTLDLDFDAVSDAAAWNDAVRGALDGFAARGVTTVINGCSAVDTQAPHPVRLVDPAETALRLLAAEGAA